jgi:hypothetical protein
MTSCLSRMTMRMTCWTWPLASLTREWAGRVGGWVCRWVGACCSGAVLRCSLGLGLLLLPCACMHAPVTVLSPHSLIRAASPPVNTAFLPFSALPHFLFPFPFPFHLLVSPLAHTLFFTPLSAPSFVEHKSNILRSCYSAPAPVCLPAAPWPRRSRLGCQVKCHLEMDGIVLRVPSIENEP